MYPVYKSIEFKGLRGQYLLVFVGGLIVLFMLFIILRMINIDTVVTVVVIAMLAMGFIVTVFKLNKKYGEHGLKKIQARRQCPKFIISRRSFYIMLRSCK